MDAKEFVRLKEALEAKKAQLARLQGKKEALLQKLQESFACASVASAEKLLVKKKKKLQELEASCQAQMQAFTEEYGDRLA